MKITIDNDNNVVSVSRDDQPSLAGSISVPDDINLIGSPEEYKWNGTSVEKKPYFAITTDAADTNGNGVADVVSGGTHNLTITARDKDGNTDTSFNAPITLAVQDAMTIYDSKQVSVVNGVGTYALSYSRVFMPVLMINVEGRFCRPGRIEYKSA